MEDVKRNLEAAIEQVYGVKAEASVAVAPEETGADFASNVAMQLAKLVHKAPIAIAEELRDALLAHGTESTARSATPVSLNKPDRTSLSGWGVEIAGPGFLNFISPDEYFYEKVVDFAKDKESLTRGLHWGEYDGKTVVCEFSDPNPFKVLHVGHLYTSMVGDAISRILEMAGAKVVRANFGGDVGLHVAKTIWAIMHKEEFGHHDSPDSGLPSGHSPENQMSKNSSLPSLTIEAIAQAYVAGTQAYDEDEQAKAEITTLNKEIYRINQEDIHEGEVAQIYWRGRELSYQYFEDFYAKIGVKFDKYYPESTVAERGLTEVRRGLDRGVYEMSDGAVVYKGEKFGLHTRVFINKEGLPTYEAKDVGLIFTKWDDWHFDESVVITGNDIIEYMKVVLASVSEMAPKLPERTRHLTHGQVKLPGNEKMSSRKGNFLKAVDVLEMVARELGDRADEKIVLAAIKYAFLKYKMGGDIVFDPKESVAMTGNSGVYLLYSAVRAKKILNSLTTTASDSPVRISPASLRASNLPCISLKNLESLEETFVRRLSKKIVQYQDTLREAVAEKAPNKICTYLFELAQEFSRFYENVKVVGGEHEATLMVVVQGYANVMEHGLNLLGMEVPEEM